MPPVPSIPPIRRACALTIPALLGAGLVASTGRADQDLLDDRPVRILPVQQQAGGGALDPNSFYGKESTEGVYVRD